VTGINDFHIGPFTFLQILAQSEKVKLINIYRTTELAMTGKLKLYFILGPVGYQQDLYDC
jgi:hypothetical protein